MPYLLKSEPDKYSFDDLVRDGETTWDGITNNTALLNLRNMKKGEKLVIYHSNVGKEAVGTATVVSVDAADPKNPIVRIKPGKRLKHPKIARRHARRRRLQGLHPLPPIPPLRRPPHRRPIRLAHPI